MAKIWWIKNFYREAFIAAGILFSPFILLIHTFFNHDEAVLNLVIFEYNHGFNSNGTFIWYLLKKALPIWLLLVWYATSGMVWREFILVALSPFIFSLVSVFIVGFEDENSFWFGYFRPGLISFIVMFLIYKRVRNLERNILSDSKLTKKYFVNTRSLRKTYGGLVRSISYLEEHKKEMHAHSYLSKLYYNKSFISKDLLDDFTSYKDIKPKITVLDILFCVLLSLIPLIFFGYKFIPDNLTSYQFYFLTIHKMGFLDVSMLIWYVSQSICLLIPLAIWFLTEKLWWRVSILSPMILAVYHIWEAFGSQSTTVDEVEYLKAAPYVLLVVLFLYFLSRIIRLKYKILDIYEWLEAEIDIILSIISPNKAIIVEFKMARRDYLSANNNLSIDCYHEKLKSIREKLQMELAERKNTERLNQ